MATFPSKVNYATGDILTATNMNDVGGAINLLQSAQFSAGKNAIINGDFGVWQRGTSISLSNSSAVYGPDRFYAQCNFSAGTSSISRQTFTPGTAPVAGYEGTYFARLTCGSTSTVAFINQRVEDVRKFAGQTITVSFWTKASTSTDVTVYINQNFGTGGSTYVGLNTTAGTITTGWTRYTGTIAIPSITGKTIGTNSFIEFQILSTTNLNSATIDYWGIQVEAASTASNFQTATGTVQGELAACQRYYFRQTANATQTSTGFGVGYAASAVNAQLIIKAPQTMRIPPSAVEFSTIQFQNYAGTGYALSLVAMNTAVSNETFIQVEGTIAGATAGHVGRWIVNSSSTGYLGFTAEL